MQIGVRIARCNSLPAPQIFTWQLPPVQFDAHMPPSLHPDLAAFFLAASDGAAEIAIAVTATAQTSKTFVIDFIWGPPRLLNTLKDCTAACRSQDQNRAWPTGG